MPAANEVIQPEGQAPEQIVSVEAARPPVPFALRWLTYLLLLPLITLATGFFGSISLLCGLWDKDGHKQHAIARLWARTLLRLAFSPVDVVNADRLRVPGAAVYASNHLSYYDTPVLFAKLPFQFRILAKASLWKVPFIGWYLSRSGQVPIDHSSARAGVISLGRGVKALQAGMPLMIFPEGGRARAGEIKPMAAGAAWMAIKAQVPLVPLTIVGTFELMPRGELVLWPRRLKLIVGTPLTTAGVTTKDADALTTRLQQEIAATYVKYHAEAGIS